MNQKKPQNTQKTKQTKTTPNPLRVLFTLIVIYLVKANEILHSSFEPFGMSLTRITLHSSLEYKSLFYIQREIILVEECATIRYNRNMNKLYKK